jgi:ABC-type multidrug transport system fused ATPase/permease subunit
MHWIIRAPGISHRLYTNTNADKINLMNKGQVAEQGAHS